MYFTETEDCNTFGKLTVPGRVVVTAMRRAPSGAAATLTCFTDVFGEKGGRACFVVFLQILHAFALYGRRRMRVATEGWPILTHDEVGFLQCVDAAVRGADTAFEAHVAWLVRGYGAREFSGYLRTLAYLMPEAPFSERPATRRAQRHEGGGCEGGSPPATKRPTPMLLAPASVARID